MREGSSVGSKYGGYRQDPEEEIGEEPSCGGLILATIVGVVVGIASSEILFTLTGVAIFDSAFFAVIMTVLVAGGVDQLLRQPRQPD